jgi:hypothetical protein
MAQHGSPQIAGVVSQTESMFLGSPQLAGVVSRAEFMRLGSLQIAGVVSPSSGLAQSTSMVLQLPDHPNPGAVDPKDGPRQPEEPRKVSPNGPLQTLHGQRGLPRFPVVHARAPSGAHWGCQVPEILTKCKNSTTTSTATAASAHAV